MKVKDFVITEFARGGTDVKVIDIMKKWMKDDSNIFVVEEDNKIVGVVTLYDILKRLIPFYLQIDEILTDFAFDDLLTPQKVEETMALQAGEIMSTKVVSIKPDDNFMKAASEMFSFEFDYLPVVDYTGHCMGLVTRNTMEEAIMKIVKKHVK